MRLRRNAFTLIEILIVVVILGILAGIVIPQFRNASRDAQQMAFIADIRVFEGAAIRYWLDNGEYLEDSASGALPAGWEPYIEENKWTSPTPLGGVWDMELNSFGIVSAFGVHFIDGPVSGIDDAYMTEIDDAFDDGDLNAGVFQKIAGDRYYYIIRD